VDDYSLWKRAASQPGRTIIVLFCDVDGLLVRGLPLSRRSNISLSQPNNSDKMPLFIILAVISNNSQKEGANKKMTQKKGYYSDCME
jgi:hypothetical protein